MITRTATAGLKVLWAEKYFEKYRKISDIVGDFSNKNHHFSDAELGMALKRANYLTRRGKRGNYKYIQKYPYVGEDKDAKRKRTK